MKRIIKGAIALFEAESNDKKVRETVESFIQEIKDGGDAAVRAISEKLDKLVARKFQIIRRTNPRNYR